jgi:hypothetical protein
MDGKEREMDSFPQPSLSQTSQFPQGLHPKRNKGHQKILIEHQVFVDRDVIG